jgi:hypothetical protein
MSVRKLTKAAFALLILTVFSAFGLGLYGSGTGMAVAAAVSALSIGFLLYIVFGTLPAGPGTMTDGCRRMFSSMPVPAIELDAAGNVKAINDAALGSGVPPSAMGRPLAGLEGALQDAGASAIELPVEREDGTTLHLLVSAVPIEKNGARSGTILIGTDDTARLKTELDRVRGEARAAEAKLTGTIRDLEEFALMAVRREIKMQEIREKLTEIREGGTHSGGGL